MISMVITDHSDDDKVDEYLSGDKDLLVKYFGAKVVTPVLGRV